MKKIFQAQKVDMEVLSPEKYLSLKAKDKSNISHTEIIPSSLGKNDFGKIKVHYKTPIYK